MMYELILPLHYKMDNEDNAKMLIKGIKSYDNYYSLITRCIGYNNNNILKKIFESDVLNEYKHMLNKDGRLFYYDKLLTKKEFLINSALSMNNLTIIKIVLKFFDIENEVKEGEEYIYENEMLINKNEELYYVLDHFEEMTGISLLVEHECLDAMVKKLKRHLTEEEVILIKTEIQSTKVRVFNMKQEMMSMTPKMYDEWLEWKENVNYYLYENYTLNDKMNIWNEFYTQYYENESENEYINDFDDDSIFDQEEQDYDY